MPDPRLQRTLKRAATRRAAEIEFFSYAAMACAHGDLEAVNALRKVLGARCARAGLSAEKADEIFVQMVDGVIGVRKTYAPAPVDVLTKRASAAPAVPPAQDGEGVVGTGID